MSRREMLGRAAAAVGAILIEPPKALTADVNGSEAMPHIDESAISKMEAELLSEVELVDVDNISHNAQITELELPIKVSDLKAAVWGAAVGAGFALIRETFAKTRGMISPRLKLNAADMERASPEKDSLHLTHSLHRYTNGAFVDNVGVFHSGKDFELQKNRIYHVIRHVDIVLLEVGTGYFDELHRFAKEQGKQVMYIDYPTAVIFAIGFANLALFLKLVTSDTEKNSGIKRSIARKLLAVPVGLASVAGLGVDALLIALKIPKKLFLSLMVDGRTILMKTNADAIADANPGKNIAMITGAVHAEGINAYYQPENQRLFKLKKMYYSIVSAPFIHRPRKAANM